MKTLKRIILHVFLFMPWLALAQTYPSGFSQVLVANGINNPTTMALSPDGRIFVTEQGGRMHVIKNGFRLPTAFLKLAVDSTGERGLLGVAFHPDFVHNSYVYVYYTVLSIPRHNRISRFTANGDVVMANSESIVLELPSLSSATNHNGGAIAFGLDGKLYVAIGENANSANSQNLDTYLGKLLRINSDGTVPTGNPFPTGSAPRQRVWAYGLRNPYTFSVQQDTGRIFVDDVGQNTYEEINDATVGGKNFGWGLAEGPSANPLFTNPVYYYTHVSGNCAITGGSFFNPSSTNYPSQYFGKYFFFDLCGRWINTIDYSSGLGVASAFATLISGMPVSMVVGNDGNLYYLSRTNKSLYKIVYNNATLPFVTSQPKGSNVLEGQPASLSVHAIGSTPMTFQWQRNGVDIPGKTSSTLAFTATVPGDSAKYRVRLSNGAGNILSQEVLLSVTTVYTPPVAKIIAPLAGATYSAGTTINFSGGASDRQEGVLQNSALEWRVDFHFGDSIQTRLTQQGISGGSYPIPNTGEKSTDAWYRFILSARDSTLLVGKDSVDVTPRKSVLSFATVPAGLHVLLDDQPLITPISVLSVVGMLRSLGVESPQTMDESIYQFASWEQGGDTNQVIETPEDSVTYTANFSLVMGVDDEPGRIDLFPNPAKEKWTTLSINSKSNQTATIRVFDILSRSVDQFNYELSQGMNVITLHLDKQSYGTYFVTVQIGDRQVIKRLVISR